MQVRLAEIEAERAAKKLAAHQAAKEKLQAAAMPPRMQLAADVSPSTTHTPINHRPRALVTGHLQTWGL